MLPLRELQRRFAAHLSGAESATSPDWIRADGITAGARLGIYRNNLHEGFTRTLALEFPVIRRLVGEDYFRQLAREFLDCHPSGSGDLHHVGAPFAAFLRARFADTDYRYLPDVAALEWACQECLVAEESAPLDPRVLRDVPLESYGMLRFSLHPACRLVASRFPILRIWEVNQPESAGTEIVDLDSGCDFVLVCRTDGRLQLRRLELGHYRLLESLAAGCNLDEALAASLECDPQFDLGEALRRSVAHRAFGPMTFPCNPSRSTP